jgi:hypothetical protein
VEIGKEEVVPLDDPSETTSQEVVIVGEEKREPTYYESDDFSTFGN